MQINCLLSWETVQLSFVNESRSIVAFCSLELLRSLMMVWIKYHLQISSPKYRILEHQLITSKHWRDRRKKNFLKVTVDRTQDSPKDAERKNFGRITTLHRFTISYWCDRMVGNCQTNQRLNETQPKRKVHFSSLKCEQNMKNTQHSLAEDGFWSMYFLLLFVNEKWL